MFPGTKVSRRPVGLSWQDNLENCLNEGKQMTAMAKIKAGAPLISAQTWGTIKWAQAMAEVRQLQMRIAKAIREERYGKAKSLQ
jgi:hypothetical protein